MRIKFNYAEGPLVMALRNDDGEMEEAVALLRDPRVLSITVTKQTPQQYLKTQRAINADEEATP